MKNVITRSLSGIVYIALIVGAILGGIGWLSGLAVLFAVFGVYEMRKLTSQPCNSLFDWSVYAVDLVAVAALICFLCLPRQMVLLPLIVVLMLCARMMLAIYDHEGGAVKGFISSCATVAYLGIPLFCLIALYAVAGKWVVLTVFILIWLNDTGAFCAGSLFGRHKMFPRLSPKKSWEGFVGGFVCCVLFGALSSLIPGWDINWGLGLGLGAVVSVAATYGDLFESLMKRTAGVKDAGNLIPGHGGILDRIDSLLLVAPLSLIYFLITYSLLNITAI